MFKIDALDAMPWPERYAALAAHARQVASGLEPGRVYSTREFAAMLLPDDRPIVGARAAKVAHWLKALAQHDGAGYYLGTRTERGNGRMRGKTVQRRLWGRPATGAPSVDLSGVI